MKIKKLLSYSGIFCLLYAAISLTVSTSYGWIIGQNRIINTNFENDEVRQPPMEWALEKGGWGCDESEYRLETDGSVAHTGRKSLKVIGITATGTASHTKMRHELVPAEDGKTFTIAFWAKVDTEQGQSREVDISVQTQNDRWPGFYSKTIALDSTDWKEYTDTFELVSDSAVEAVWVGLCIAQSDVDFWIDDFRFFEGTTSDEVEYVETAIGSRGKTHATWGSIRAGY